MRRALYLGAAAALIAPFATAQFTLTGPDSVYATQEGNSNFALPWNVGSTSVARVQFFQDSSVFTNQGVTTPIRITALRYRADTIANTWTGRSLPCVIDMSTAAVDYLSVTNTFASNHGANLTNVFNGVVTVTPGAGGSMPGLWNVFVQLTTPFVYDPTTGGDLAIDFKVTGATGTAGPIDHVGPGASPPALGSRVWDGNATAHTTATAQWVNLNYAPVCEFTYEPATGLWPNFAATPATGPSPLNVQFADRTITDAPGGILAWQWDLDGDSVIDSTVQNPSFTYTNCGSYNVTLTVIDGLNGQRTVTKNGFITTDVVQPEFSYSVQPGYTVLFTDNTPGATSWAWDFDGDNVTDSTAQNPVFVYPLGNTVWQVKLTASRLCGPPASRVHAVAMAANSITTRLTGGIGTFGSTTGTLFDVTVLNPLGINIGAITNCPYTDILPIGSPIGCEIYITDAAGGYASNHNNAAVWRLAAIGSGRFEGGNAGSPVPTPMALDRPIYLAPGTYGMAVYMIGCGMGYSGLANAANADLSITTGGSKFGIFSATMTANRAWNGTLHYGTQQTTDGAGFGFFGAGCAGSGGIANQSFTGAPNLGRSLTVTVDSLPQNVMVYLLGFSRTNSAFGPLPFDLTGLGAPGCLGRVSIESQILAIGGSNTASLTFAVPVLPALNGMQLFTQPIVLDPGFNLLGATAGDAWAMLIAP